MVATIIVARILGTDGYGRVGMVQSTLGMLGVLAGFGLGTTATKCVAEFRETDPVKLGRILGLLGLFSLICTTIMSISCFLAAPWLAVHTLNRPDLTEVVAAGALLLFLSAIVGLLTAALSGFESFQAIAWINVVQGIAAPLLAFPLVWNFGVLGAIHSFTLQALLGAILLSRALQGECRKFRIHISIDEQIFRELHILWRYSLPTLLGGLVVAPTMWVSNLILINQVGGYGEMGLFNAANQWRQVVLFLPNLFMAAILPVLAERHNENDKRDYIQTVSLNLQFMWAFTLPLTVLAITWRLPLSALFGKNFIDSSEIMVILILATFLNLINAVVGAALAGAGQMWTGLLMNLGWAVVLLGFSFWLIPIWGGKGLASAFLGAYLVHTVWVMIYVEKRLAPNSISRHRIMIGSSVILLIVATAEGFFYPQWYVASALLIMISTIPLVMMIKRGYDHLKPSET